MPSDEAWLEGYRKYIKEWSNYTNRMRRMQYDQIEHDFNGSSPMVCSRCNTHWDQINAGSASWICSVARTMPCCSQHGLEVYDYTKGAWKCNQCGSTTSTDYFYPSSRGDAVLPSTPAPKAVELKKCTCTIQKLMRGGCDCGGV